MCKEKEIETKEEKQKRGNNKTFYDNAIFDPSVNKIIFFEGESCIGQCSIADFLKEKNYEFVDDQGVDLFNTIMLNLHNYLEEGVELKQKKTPTLDKWM